MFQPCWDLCFDPVEPHFEVQTLDSLHMSLQHDWGQSEGTIFTIALWIIFDNTVAAITGFLKELLVCNGNARQNRRDAMLILGIFRVQFQNLLY